MTDEAIRRRDFLTKSGMAGAFVATSGEAVAAKAMPQAADLVLRNGKIITVDPEFTIARAVAIAGDRIIAVGSDAAMKSYTGPGTRVIDLKNKAVIPGLIDGHAHMDREGLKTIYSPRSGESDPCGIFRLGSPILPANLSLANGL